MKKVTVPLPSAAMVVASVALFAALGGTGYAATRLIHSPKARIAKAGDTAADTKLIKKLAPSLSVRFAHTAGSASSATNAGHASSADSATHATSADSATHATSADSATHATNADTATNATTAGNANQLGGVAAASYQTYNSTLPSGQTETGAWGGGFTAAAASADNFVIESFPIPLAAALDSAHVVYVPGASATHCSGAGHAAAGYLCAYQLASANNSSPTIDAVSGGPGASTSGFTVVVQPSGAGFTYLTGTYAVTAP